MEATLSDFPKIQCPFIRQTYAVERDSFRRGGKKANLRKSEAYLVVDQVNPGYEWVFDDPQTFAVEKLDGTNVKLLTEAGVITAVQNRLNVIQPLGVKPGIGLYIMEGIVAAAQRGYIEPGGEQAGELLGPKLQGNPYGLDQHLWYPFERAHSQLRYRSFDEHDRTFDNWSSWFKDYLTSLFHRKIVDRKGESGRTVMAEGVVFYNLERKAKGLTWMAKLRRDMFDWYYAEHVTIRDYDKRGREETEPQDQFD